MVLFCFFLFAIQVDDELLQVTRVQYSNNVPATGVPRTLRGGPPILSEDFTEHVITGVRFAALLNNPEMPTVIRSRIWGPSLHKHYPESFRLSCKEILLCSCAPIFQLPPIDPSPTVENQINLAAHLPKSIWIEILSYTHRDWFAQPHSDVDMLRRRLEQEQLAVRRAEEARRDAEMRLRVMERERDGYRRLAVRVQARLQAIMNDRGENLGEPDDMLTDDDASHGAFFNPSDAIFLGLSGRSAIIRRLQQDLSDDHDDDAEDDMENGVDDFMNRGEIGAETLDDESTSSDDDVSDENESSSLESVLPTMQVVRSPVASSPKTIGRPTRTVSVSSDDMKISILR
jgi:hypothetical protein